MKLLALGILLLGSAVGFSQEDPEEIIPVVSFNVRVIDEATGKGLEGAVVDISGGTELSQKSDKSGKVKPMILELNKEFKAVIHKDGYQQKIATINSTIEYTWGMNEKVPFDLVVTLFKKEAALDLAFMDTMPMIKFHFNWDGRQAWNKTYTDNMSRRVELIRAGQPSDVVFEQFELMEQSDIAYIDGNIDTALTLYQKAYDLIPREDLLPRLEELKDEHRRWDWGYSEYIKEADRIFASGHDLLTARLYYINAANKANDEGYEYSWDQIEKIDKLVYGEYEIDWETYVYYQHMLRAGYENMEEGNYDEALKWYNKASKFHPEDPFPKQKIKEINGILAKKK